MLICNCYESTELFCFKIVFLSVSAACVVFPRAWQLAAATYCRFTCLSRLLLHLELQCYTVSFGLLRRTLFFFYAVHCRFAQAVHCFFVATSVDGGLLNGTAESVLSGGLLWTIAPVGVCFGVALGEWRWQLLPRVAGSCGYSVTAAGVAGLRKIQSIWGLFVLELRALLWALQFEGFSWALTFDDVASYFALRDSQRVI